MDLGAAVSFVTGSARLLDRRRLDLLLVADGQQQHVGVRGGRGRARGLRSTPLHGGRAPVGVCATGTGPNNADGTSTTCQQAIEGVTGRFYGGPTKADSSGNFQYVQIRYSGIAISDGNELQGLTLGGTGSGTSSSSRITCDGNSI